MNYEVVISKKAKSDISKIYSHILHKFKSTINANSVLNKIYSELEDLSFMAGSYHLYPNEPWHSKGMHYYSVKNYSIFYDVTENIDKTDYDGVVTVLHVIYGKRDLDAVLRNN